MYACVFEYAPAWVGWWRNDEGLCPWTTRYVDVIIQIKIDLSSICVEVHRRSILALSHSEHESGSPCLKYEQLPICLHGSHQD